MDKKPDFLILGGGIMGLTTAIALKQHYPDQSVSLLEKEVNCGLHASGRNSGVLHAGFYYTSDSLKARFTREGNLRLTNYCLENNLDINRCGKLVVAQNEDELSELDELYQRGLANGIELTSISASEAKKIEPRAKTFQRALFSPTTSSISPQQIIRQLTKDAENAGICIHPNTRYLTKKGSGIATTAGIFHPGYLINMAGLYADKIAHQFSFAKNYRILPFKGLYLYSDELPGSLRTHVYPVPELDKPFLGVHFTFTVDGHYKIGPTAIPALWREQYHRLDNFNLRELLKIGGTELGLMFNNQFNFKKLALNELTKYYRPHLVSLASKLINEIRSKQIKSWGKPGIRAQLVDTQKRTLEMDFCYQGDSNSFHLLNAVSPAFTCSFPLAEFCVQRIEKLTSSLAIKPSTL